MQEREILSYWYAGRVKYNTEKRIKDFLVQNNITNYIPFEKKIIERNNCRMSVARPQIPCYIFVCTDYNTLLTLPKQCGYNISFVRNIVTHKIQEIPDKQMQDLMFMLDFSQTNSIIADNTLKHGSKVRIIKGNFAGIEGELIRIKGHKRVVVRLEGMFAVACNTYLPKDWLEVIES
ncbi:MAG: UpxY family transcription antiterminator [Paludibacter sp.]|nr:UpxY family transcription antiterminator [Paludibacter sp.]